MIELTEVRFRSNPEIELKTLAELPAEQQDAFRELERDAGFYGLLVPRAPSAVNLKSVDRETAELFRGLTVPSHLDSALLTDDEGRADVIDLVLDSILEIETGGAFVSGADAAALLFPDALACHPEPRGRRRTFSGSAPPEKPFGVCAPQGDTATARLSTEALRYAQDLSSAVPQVLTSAIYFYNRIPISRFWTARFRDRDTVAAHLGIDNGPLAALLDQHWHSVAAEKSNGWISWFPRQPRRRESSDVTFKLYVSPRPEHIRDAFEAVVRVLAGIPGSQMKIGQDAAGLLRPDKLVAYFFSREELDEAAEAMLRELAGCPAQGVPFTAGIDANGLVSWGLDPPETERALSWLNRESWRLWLAQRLGNAMAVAKQARTRSIEPYRFAIERVRRLGVDVANWTPAESLWRAQ